MISEGEGNIRGKLGTQEDFVASPNEYLSFPRKD